MNRFTKFIALSGAAVSLCAQPRSAVSNEVVINSHVLTTAEKLAIVRTYRVVPIPGRYWYDAMSGLWGAEGGAPYGMILPGYDFGPLSPKASNGQSGVFLNGREVSNAEVLFYFSLFGSVRPGRYWLNGFTGMIGLEGSPYPVVNLYAAYNQRFGRGGASSKIGINGYVSTDGNGGALINDGVNGPIWTPN